MRFQKANKYLYEKHNLTMPTENTVEWLENHGLPVIVACAECGMTITLPSAMIDKDGTVYCMSCANH